MHRVLDNGYVVHSDGRVYSPSGKLLREMVNHSGYHRVNIGTKHNEQKKVAVHRLVANTFIPNPHNKPCVNHIDGDKSNNRVSNLEWCTVAENNLHRYQVLEKRGKKLNWELVRKIRKEKPDYSHSQLAKRYGVSKASIKDIISGRSWVE